MTIASRPLSPCIQHCQLDPANTCQGCGRTLDEIAYWGGNPPIYNRGDK